MKPSRIVNVQDPGVDAIVSFIFIAAVEMLCCLSAEDATVAYFSELAACSFLTIAVLLAWSLIRFEHQPFARGHQQQ